MKTRRLILSLAIILSFSYLSVYADIFPTKENVKLDKDWIIKFNKKLDFSTVNNNNIYITDETDNEIQSLVSLLSDGYSALIKPLNKYYPNKKYSLHISKNLKTEEGKNLTTSSIMEFVTVNRKLDIEEIAKKSDALVYITAEDNYDTSQGSGFFISSDGILVTNYHVIEGYTNVDILLEDDRIFHNPKVLGYDIDKDIAILKIDTDNVPFCKLGNSENVVQGKSIITIGSPKGMFNTLSTGVVSQIYPYGIQISAPISEGSSGGALFNMYGEVIGITSSGIKDGENIGFAIPINELKSIAQDKNMTLEELYNLEYTLSSEDINSPENVVAIPVSDSEINLAWDPVEDADFYYVYESNNPIGPYTILKDDEGFKKKFYWDKDTSASIIGIKPNTTLYYKITSVKNGKESTFSNTVHATTLDLNEHIDDDSYKYISIIEDSNLDQYPSPTVGEAFESFFSNTSWEYFFSSDNCNIVEFSGQYYYNNKLVNAKIQFQLELDKNTFFVYYMGIDGKSLTDKEQHDFLQEVYNTP